MSTNRLGSGSRAARTALIEACDDPENTERLIHLVHEHSRAVATGQRHNRPIDPVWANTYLRDPNLRSKMAKLTLDGDCILVRGSLASGYVLVGPGVLAHRVVVTAVTGLSLDGLHVDHMCGVRACINPRHLQPLHPAVHMAADAEVGGEPLVRDKKARISCARLGHPLEGRNLALSKGARRCVACQMAARASREARINGRFDGMTREQINLYVDTLADTLYDYREIGGYTGRRGKRPYFIAGRERRLTHPEDWMDLMATSR